MFFTRATGIPDTLMLEHLELRGNELQLLTDVSADFRSWTTAAGTKALCVAQFMNDRFPRKMIGERAASMTLWLRLLRRLVVGAVVRGDGVDDALFELIGQVDEFLR